MHFSLAVWQQDLASGAQDCVLWEQGAEGAGILRCVGVPGAERGLVWFTSTGTQAKVRGGSFRLPRHLPASGQAACGPVETEMDQRPPSWPPVWTPSSSNGKLRSPCLQEAFSGCTNSNGPSSPSACRALSLRACLSSGRWGDTHTGWEQPGSGAKPCPHGLLCNHVAVQQMCPRLGCGVGFLHLEPPFKERLPEPLGKVRTIQTECV